jgi:hypothetical protein
MRVLAASCLVLAGCLVEEPFLSTDVATRDITAAVTAEGDAQRTRVSVNLSGPGGYVRLIEADRITVRADGRETNMERREGDVYEAAVAPGAEDLAVLLDRPAPAEDAVLAFSMAPATALTAPRRATRAEPLEVSWAASEGPHTTTLAVAGSCLPAISRVLTVDVGRYVFQAADLAGESTETCEATVTLTRALVEEPVAHPLARTYVSSTQIATRAFESSP